MEIDKIEKKPINNIRLHEEKKKNVSKIQLYSYILFAYILEINKTMAYKLKVTFLFCLMPIKQTNLIDFK